MNLQSGFVLAIVLGLVLFVDRFGGTDEVARRLFQIALGATLAFTVAAGTIAVIEPDFSDTGRAIFSAESGNEDDRLAAIDISDRSVIANGVRFGAGIIALLFGLGGLARWSTVPLGIALGGVLLIFAGGGGNELFGFAAFYTASSRSSQEVDFAYFAITLIGLGALLWYGFNQWEAEPVSDDGANEDLETSEI